METNVKQCGHITLRAPYMPCPHRECCTQQHIRIAAAVQVGPATYAGDSTSFPVASVDYIRDQLVLDGEAYWAWRRVK